MELERKRGEPRSYPYPVFQKAIRPAIPTSSTLEELEKEASLMGKPKVLAWIDKDRANDWWSWSLGRLYAEGALALLHQGRAGGVLGGNPG